MFIVAGFRTADSNCPPEILYIGDDGELANRLGEAAPHPRVAKLNNPPWQPIRHFDDEAAAAYEKAIAAELAELGEGIESLEIYSLTREQLLSLAITTGQEYRKVLDDLAGNAESMKQTHDALIAKATDLEKLLAVRDQEKQDLETLLSLSPSADEVEKVLQESAALREQLVLAEQKLSGNPPATPPDHTPGTHVEAAAVTTAAPSDVPAAEKELPPPDEPKTTGPESPTGEAADLLGKVSGAEPKAKPRRGN